MPEKQAIPRALQIDESEVVLRIRDASAGHLASQVETAIKQTAELKNQLDDAVRDANKQRRELLLSVIDVCDALDRTLAHLPDRGDPQQKFDQLLRNTQSLRRLIQQKLALAGVSQVPRISSAFDDSLDDVDSYVARADLPLDTVVFELQACYRLNKNVLRRGRVVLSSPDPDP